MWNEGQRHPDAGVLVARILAGGCTETEVFSKPMTITGIFDGRGQRAFADNLEVNGRLRKILVLVSELG